MRSFSDTTQLDLWPLRLKLVLPWIVQAFSGFLVPVQLLYLWDLILGIDSLYVVPLLAAAILSLRRENLRRVQTHEAAESICHDLSTIQVIPLLQMALTQDTKEFLDTIWPWLRC